HLARGALRVQHIRALARLQAMSALPILAALLRDGDAQVAAAAAAALGELALQDRRPLLPLAGPLASMMMVHRPVIVAKEAALAFARLRPRGHREGFVRMVRLTFHQDAAVRARVARALGQYGDRLARAALTRLLSDRVAAVQAAAAVALARLRAHKATGRIHALLATTPTQQVALRASYTLALAILDRSRQPEAVRAIRTALESGPNTGAKAGFVSLLAAERGRWVTQLLQQARRSPSYLVRAAARRALSIWPPPVRPAPRVAAPHKRSHKKATAVESQEQASDESIAGPYSAPKKRAHGCGCSAGDSTQALPIPISLVLLWLARRRRRRERASSLKSQSLDNQGRTQ
ncbi:MAG: HEAT repeat domain-containing protein, partial [bacterium]